MNWITVKDQMPDTRGKELTSLPLVFKVKGGEFYGYYHENGVFYREGTEDGEWYMAIPDTATKEMVHYTLREGFVELKRVTEWKYV